MKIVGTAQEYNRKDNRMEVTAFIAIEGNVYRALDLGLGGFRIDGYEGELMSGSEFLVEGLGINEEDIIAVRIDCTVARRLGNQMGAGFVELDSLSYDVIDALMMRKKRFFEKMKNK